MPNLMISDAMDGAAAATTASSLTRDPATMSATNALAAPPPSAAWSNDDALDRVRESLRAARQQVEGAVAVLRERGALNMDATEAFTRARTLCHHAERRLATACGALAPRTEH